MEAKLRDEMVEKSSAGDGEAGFAHEDAGKVVVKMDVRYVFCCFVPFLPSPFQNLTRIFRILPILALLFLCSFIDRTNVGNAKILGLEKDIHINDHQYAIGLCVFYATYIAR
jgi:hypothetical protein